MASVGFRDVRKSYGRVAVLHGVEFEIADGEFVVLVGPSGCGKSTLLRMLAGLEEITGGEILIDGKVVNDLESKDRDIAMVFQSYALYPHMTVRENMGFSLRLRRADAAETDRRVGDAARILNLDALLDRYPRELSGGQRQRVAMGRAIVRDPKVFLFDEPLSNLDAKLRVAMRSEIKALHQRLKTTTVYVTHDQIEAMTMADRPGRVQDGAVQALGAHWPLPPGTQAASGQDVHYGIRPGDLQLADQGIPARVVVVEPTGAETELLLETGGQRLTLVLHGRTSAQPDDTVHLRLKPASAHVFDARTGQRL